ncbi:MAG: glycosyltransferase, partial [Nitrospirota bacterium]
KKKIIKYPLHISKYLYNAFAVKPQKNIKLAHILFPFYLTDLITIHRLKRKGTKVILTVHEILPHKLFLGGDIDKKMKKTMYDIADKLLVHTASLKKEIIESFYQPSDKIQIIPHGYFNLPPSSVARTNLQVKYHVPEGKKILLFFGSIRENKGLDILLDTMKDLKDEYFLLITGQRAGLSEKPIEYYRDMIRKNNLSNSVSWVEKYITNEEAAEVFKVADALVLPYKRSFHAQSGVLNLAINFERPCVVSDVGGIGEVVKEFNLGIVVKPEDIPDLQNGITALFAEKREFDFNRYKEENSWEKVCEKLIAVYEAELRRIL